MVEFLQPLQFDILEEFLIKTKPQLQRIKFHMRQLQGIECARGNILVTEEIHVEIYNEFIDDFLSKLNNIKFETTSMVISASQSVIVSSTSFRKLECFFNVIVSIFLLYHS